MFNLLTYVKGLIRARANVNNELLRDITDIEIDGIDMRDAPDFCDAYITYAAWKSTGTELTDKQLDQLNNHSDYVYEQVINYIY